jgi:hypothetical protein
MRKLGTGLLAFFLIFPFSAPAEASTKSASLTKAFQKYLSDAEVNHSKSLANSKALYEPQIFGAIEKLKAAQLQFARVNQVTILKSTSHSPTAPIEISSVTCPVVRPDCKDSNYKSNEFKAGEIANVMDFVGGDSAFTTDPGPSMNFGILQTIDLQIKDGLISLNNASAYNEAVSTIRTQYQNALSLSQQYSSAQSAANDALLEVQSRESAIKSAIVSAKRASVNSATFDKAFLTSLKFEYNAKRLDELARQPWTYISSLKSLQDAVSVTKQSSLADSISASYSYSAALKFNATYGNLFLVEDDYKNGFQVINAIYKTVTRISLSGK